MVKVEIEREMCISCRNCIDSCPQYFEFAEDGFSTLIGGQSVGDNVELEIEDAGCTVIAEENCPVFIIHVYE